MELKMTRYNAIKNIPTENKLTASRVFNQYIIAYETLSGDSDPAAWFQSRTATINRDLIKTGADSMENAGTAAADYYFNLSS
jgi:hypothetical protein